MSDLPSGLTAAGAWKGTRRNLLAFAVAGLCAWAVAGRLGEVDLAEVLTSIRAVGPAQWTAALLATALSFVAVGQYDALFHRWLGTGVAPRRAVLSGAAAIALAQTLGFGLATGTVARWRALPELPLAAALRMTNYVSFSFMVALGLLTAAALALPGAGPAGSGLFAALALVAFATAVALSLARPAWLKVPLPPLRLMGHLTGLAALDTALAALALWVFLPEAAQPAFPVFLAAFLLSLGAGLLSGAPGGVGPFELCLVTLLPQVPETELVAAILAFRLVYYALPACIAVLPLARPVRAGVPIAEGPAAPPRVRRADAGFARQTGAVAAVAGRAMHLAPASQTLVALGDPLCGSAFDGAALAGLAAQARDRHHWPALYKCGARAAVTARAAGWAVMAVSEEAWVDPRAFTPEGPARRQLRRKLAQARKAGVTVARARLLPLPQMAQVAAAWAERSGGERGFSMGRFEPGYLSGQRVYLAWRAERLVAFATFHLEGGDWSLDLMRSADGAPDGTIHALVAEAIAEAAAEGAARLSLAAMPLGTPPAPLRALAARREARGLRQFKSSFAPRTRRLYLAAPSAPLLALSAADILLAIQRPAPLRADPSRTGSDDGAPAEVRAL